MLILNFKIFLFKETAGKAIGNQQMQAEGNVTKNTGDAKKEIHKH